MSEMKNSEIAVKMIRVDRIQTNPHNYNEMTRAEFEEYKTEVSRHGRPPKPVIVRELDDDSYEIVDGEHAWRASKEVGLTEIPCEILDVDEFEAMRESFKRNRGGKDNPVRLGRMFLRMKKTRQLSLRKLAGEINVAVSTIRNAISYAKAARLRSQYAGENRDKEIAKLSCRQIEMYHRLPEEMRNLWLDAGGDIDDLSWSYEYHVSQIIPPLRKADLFWLLQGKDYRFRRSLEYALPLAEWRVQHERLEDVNSYVRAVAELHLPVQVLDCLPCQHLEDDLSAKPLLPIETWRAILRNASERTSKREDQLALVESGIRVALRDAGLDLTEVYNAHIVEMLQLIAEAPTSVRDCDFLTVEEQFELLGVPVEDVPAEEIEAAQEATLEHFKRKRTSEPGAARHSGAPDGRSVTEVFLEELWKIRQQAEDDDFFSDNTALLESTIRHLADCPVLRDADIDGRQVTDVLDERLQNVDWPEFYLIASLVRSVDTVDEACRRWLRALKGDTEPEEPISPVTTGRQRRKPSRRA